MPQLLLFGNCQSQTLAEFFQTIGKDVVASAIVPTPANLDALRRGKFDAALASADLILLQPGAWQPLNGNGTGQFALPDGAQDPVRQVRMYAASFHGGRTIRQVPKILFSAFHPDIDFVRHASGATFHGRFGHHSALAFWAWQAGLNLADAVSLFREEVFHHLGYFDYWEPARAALAAEGVLGDLPLDELIESWGRSAPWMYSFNHPALPVLADVANALLTREGIAVKREHAPQLEDVIARQVMFPVYPSIAAHLGFSSDYRFIESASADRQGAARRCFTLEQFVGASFDAYEQSPRTKLSCRRLEGARYKALAEFVRPRRAPHRSRGPYATLPDHCFWSKAVATQPAEAVDPVVGVSFAIAPTDKVATAGSCFAQRLSLALRESGFTFYIAESGEQFGVSSAEHRGFEAFSARYGNIYTARQLLQLFDRAFGRFEPEDVAWLRPDGRFVDPFRPQIEPAGFATVDSLVRARAEHLAATRRMFETLEVFVFTLGLTEGWRRASDGAVFPLAPGTVAGTFDPAIYEFVNFRTADVVSDLRAFLARLRRVNAAARCILSVSPVPLVATFEKRHVLASTTYSKAVLRAAAQEVCELEPRCDYFPSYEIITGAHTRGRYFADDLRSITAEGVAQVVNTFFRHYTEVAPIQSDVAAQVASQRDVLCDEDAIAPVGLSIDQNRSLGDGWSGLSIIEDSDINATAQRPLLR